MDFLFGYAGGQYDGETGLQYHQARYYDPATGRFLGEDPSSFAGGDTNLYRYANGDPVNRTDPTGLAARQLGNVTAALTGSPVLGVMAGYSYSTQWSGTGQSVSSTPSSNPLVSSSSLSHWFEAGAYAGTSRNVGASASVRVPYTEQQGRAMREQEETQRFYGSLPAGTAVFSANSLDYRQRQQDSLNKLDGGYSIFASGVVSFSNALARLGMGEARNPTLETPDQRIANDRSEQVFGAALLTLNAALIAPNTPVSTLFRSGVTVPTTVPSAALRPQTPLSVVHSSLLESRSITVGLERRPIVSRFDTFTASQSKAAGLRPGSVSGNPANQLLETGTPLASGQGRAKRWYRITPEDAQVYREATADRISELQL